MLAYKLNTKIEIFETVKTKNNIGAFVESDVLKASIFADVTAGMGRTVTNDDRVIHTNETTFIIRNYPMISYKMFVKYNGEKYKIIGLQLLPNGSGQIIKAAMI